MVTYAAIRAEANREPLTACKRHIRTDFLHVSGCVSTQFRSIKYEHLLAQKKAPILERLARKKQSDAGTEFGKGLPKKEKIAFVHLDKSYPEIKSEKAEAETKPTTSPVSKPETKTQQEFQVVQSQDLNRSRRKSLK